MWELDYESVGFKCGLEVHQQLLTKEKMFCRCPAGLYTDSHDGEVLRHMRPTLSELGEYDGTALMEFKTRKEIIYLLHKSNVCTYEMDDTPPFLVNQESIDVAIQLCLMMNMDIIDEVHIARKQYLDGSIPTGFQRTAIVGMNGWLPFKDRRLTVTHVSVEEDSCREVSDEGHRIIWRTDRLGMPLTETVTGPELMNPQEVREAITLCGLTARTTRRVRTGMGASRQDVNVSVAGGARCEIKGVPRAAAAVKLTHNEAIRQVNLLKLRDELHKRGLREDADVRMGQADVTNIFHAINLPYINDALKEGHRVWAIKIEGAAATATFQTQPYTTFLDELSGRVRVIACLDVPPIILSGAMMSAVPQIARAREKVRRRLNCGDKDAWFIVWGPERDCRTAAEEVRLRYVDATQGIPMETRQALQGGFTTFERILPGPDRMYPDTDSPPTRVTRERVERLKLELPPFPWVREKQYQSWGVPQETTHWLIRYGGADVVEEIVERTGADGKTVAVTIGQTAKGLKRLGIGVDRLGTEGWVKVFKLFAEDRLPREMIPAVVSQLALQPELTEADAAAAAGIALVPTEEWQSAARSVEDDEYKVFNHDTPQRKTRWMTGKAVRMLKGKAPAVEVAAFIKSEMGVEK